MKINKFFLLMISTLVFFSGCSHIKQEALCGNERNNNVAIITRNDGVVGFTVAFIARPQYVKLIFGSKSYPMELCKYSEENSSYEYCITLPETIAKEGIIYKFVYKIGKIEYTTDESMLKLPVMYP